MENRPRGEAAPVSPFAQRVVTQYEQAILADNAKEIEAKEDFIYEGVLEIPAQIAPVYEALANSDLEVVRQVAATKGIREAFKVDPEVGGRTWNRLLNDESPVVAKWAYEEFRDYVAAIESGLEHDRDLAPIYSPGSEN